MVVFALYCDGTPRLAWTAILSAWVKLFAPILEGKYAWRALVICISSRGGASCRSSWGGSCCSSSCYPWMEWPKLISYERYLAWTWLSHLHKLQLHYYHHTPSPPRDRRRLPWIGCTPCHSDLWHPCAKIQQRIIVCFLQMFAATAKKKSKINDMKKLILPGPQTKRHPEKGGKLNTSQAGSVAASRAAVGQFLSISCEAFILRTR